MKEMLSKARFKHVRVSRVIHSAGFDSLQHVWSLATLAVPVVDVRKISEDKVKAARLKFASEVGVDDENTPVFLLTASNVVTMTVEASSSAQ